MENFTYGVIATIAVIAFLVHGFFSSLGNRSTLSSKVVNFLSDIFK